MTLSILAHRAILELHGFNPVILKGFTFSNPKSIEVFTVHGEWFYVLSFPVEAALFYFIVARPLYTYIECIVITMYVFSITFVFFIVCYLIGGLLLGLNVLHWAFYLFQVLVTMLYSMYVIYQLCKNRVNFLWPRILLHFASGIIILKYMECLSDLWVKLFHH